MTPIKIKRNAVWTTRGILQYRPGQFYSPLDLFPGPRNYNYPHYPPGKNQIMTKTLISHVGTVAFSTESGRGVAIVVCVLS